MITTSRNLGLLIPSKSTRTLTLRAAKSQGGPQVGALSLSAGIALSIGVRPRAQSVSPAARPNYTASDLPLHRVWDCNQSDETSDLHMIFEYIPMQLQHWGLHDAEDLAKSAIWTARTYGSRRKFGPKLYDWLRFWVQKIQQMRLRNT